MLILLLLWRSEKRRGRSGKRSCRTMASEPEGCWGLADVDSCLKDLMPGCERNNVCWLCRSRVPAPKHLLYIVLVPGRSEWKTLMRYVSSGYVASCNVGIKVGLK